MRTFISLPQKCLTVWLSAFFTPSAYFLLLLVADKFFLPSPPDIAVASLFYLFPAVALLVCGSAVWFSNMTINRKIGWMLFTLFGMLLQFGLLLAIIIAATGFA
jgi:hypothetical protein